VEEGRPLNKHPHVLMEGDAFFVVWRAPVHFPFRGAKCATFILTHDVPKCATMILAHVGYFGRFFQEHSSIVRMCVQMVFARYAYEILLRGVLGTNSW
jgi:hypothetical protein